MGETFVFLRVRGRLYTDIRISFRPGFCFGVRSNERNSKSDLEIFEVLALALAYEIVSFEVTIYGPGHGWLRLSSMLD